MRKREEKNLVWNVVRILLAPLIIVSVFLLVWLKSEITSLEYRISDFENKRLGLLKDKKELILKRSDILSIENVEHVAMNRFGLTFPDRKKVFYVKRGEGPYNVRADYGSYSD